MYLIRLDDASEYMDTYKWNKIENLLDKYNIKPIVGVIPNNEDKKLVNGYDKDYNFWRLVNYWQDKGWEIALHGYNHVYLTKEKGINPVNKKSEFAGVNLQVQKQKIRDGIYILQKNNINPKIFFAPSHTFDKNTLIALKSESNINVISDTIANDIYFKDDFYFIPQQIGSPRNLYLKLVTICLHPNTMTNNDFIKLDKFLYNNKNKFTSFNNIELKNKQLNLYDKALSKLYFILRKLSNK